MDQERNFDNEFGGVQEKILVHKLSSILLQLLTILVVQISHRFLVVKEEFCIINIMDLDSC